VLPFPIQPGVDVELIARRFLEQRRQSGESSKPTGITLERPNLRTTPRGNFVVAQYVGSQDRQVVRRRPTLSREGAQPR
jgi:hypothetical protein